MEDARIVELFFHRSEEAVRALAETYGGMCRRLAVNVLKNDQDAEECVNDAYLAVWNAVPPARPLPLLPYLCRIVRNLSIECYRRRHAAKRDDSLTRSWDELEPFLPSADSPEAQTDARELTRLLNVYLEGLAPRDQLLFMRRYWFFDSCAEIARISGLSEKNVSVRLTRLRKKLRIFLEENEVYL